MWKSLFSLFPRFCVGTLPVLLVKKPLLRRSVATRSIFLLSIVSCSHCMLVPTLLRGNVTCTSSEETVATPERSNESMFFVLLSIVSCSHCLLVPTLLRGNVTCTSSEETVATPERSNESMFFVLLSIVSCSHCLLVPTLLRGNGKRLQYSFNLF